MSLSTTTEPNHRNFCFIGMPSVSTIFLKMVECRGWYARAYLNSFSLLCYLVTFGFRERSTSLSTTTEPNHRKSRFTCMPSVSSTTKKKGQVLWLVCTSFFGTIFASMFFTHIWPPRKLNVALHNHCTKSHKVLFCWKPWRPLSNQQQEIIQLRQFCICNCGSNLNISLRSLQLYQY